MQIHWRPIKNQKRYFMRPEALITYIENHGIRMERSILNPYLAYKNGFLNEFDK